MEVVKDVYIPMRDGVHLAADIYRPEAPGRYPAILQRTPYLKSGTVTARLAADGLPAVSGVGGTPVGIAGQAKPLVEAGYVVIVSDARGTGFSEGVYDYYDHRSGQFDGYDCIEWVAAQEWCEGNVGMMGASAGALYCYLAAFRNPPHLKAMTVNMHPNDIYFDQWFVGGVFRYENRIGWSTGMLARVSPQDPGEPGSNNYEWKRKVYRERYEQYHQRMAAGRNPVNLDWLTEMYQHPAYDAYWKERSFASRMAGVTTPTLHGGVLWDHFGRGTVMAHDALNAPKRLFMSPGGLVPGAIDPEGGYAALQRRWFDHFLKGIDNGVTEGPAARHYLMGSHEWVDEPRWPVPTRDECLHLGAGGGLGRAPSGAPDPISHNPSEPRPTPRNPHDQEAGPGTLSYQTAPLAEATTVIGMPHLRLFGSTDAKDVDWIVRLQDVAPNGKAQLVNMGALKGSHVASHESPSDLEPGKVYEFDIEIWPVSNTFKQGHRIRIDIANSDFPFFEANPLASHSQVLHDDAHPSRLVLPVRA